MSSVIDITTASATELRKLVKIPFLKDVVEAEIGRREANAEVINAEVIANASALLVSLGFDVTDTVALANAYVRIKSSNMTWYDLSAESMPAPLASLRSALFVVANAGGMPAEANARKKWFAEQSTAVTA